MEQEQCVSDNVVMCGEMMPKWLFMVVNRRRRRIRRSHPGQIQLPSMENDTRRASIMQTHANRSAMLIHLRGADVGGRVVNCGECVQRLRAVEAGHRRDGDAYHRTDRARPNSRIESNGRAVQLPGPMVLVDFTFCMSGYMVDIGRRRGMQSADTLLRIIIENVGALRRNPPSRRFQFTSRMPVNPPLKPDQRRSEPRFIVARAIAARSAATSSTTLPTTPTSAGAIFKCLQRGWVPLEDSGGDSETRGRAAGRQTQPPHDGRLVAIRDTITDTAAAQLKPATHWQPLFCCFRRTRSCDAVVGEDVQQHVARRGRSDRTEGAPRRSLERTASGRSPSGSCDTESCGRPAAAHGARNEPSATQPHHRRRRRG